MSFTNFISQIGAAGAETSNPWDISGAQYNGSPVNWFNVGAQEQSSQGVFFKPDGLKMYVVGAAGDAVYEYDLSTAWDVSSASYLQNFSVSAQDTTPTGVFFKSDGLSMYIVGGVGTDINQYALTTAWDISTASYLRRFSIFSDGSNPTGVFFKPDGTKMYVVNRGDDEVNEYDLSTAWNISSASYLQNFSVSAQETFPTDLFFKPDGLKMYIVGRDGDAVYEYDLSTAWNISTASFLQNVSVAVQETAPEGVFFKDDGTKMYIVGGLGDAVYEYDLSTAWDISTAVWPAPTSDYFNVSAQETGPTGLFFKPDGTKVYIVGSLGDAVYEYDLSTAWDISSASYLQNFSVSAQETGARGVFFKPDGLKMYVVGTVGDAVYEYDLSTAWDISTASWTAPTTNYYGVPSVNPEGLSFKDDGTKMYVLDISGVDVSEYDLSTAWEISTASFLQSFSISAQELSPRDMFFKPDGTRMYVTGGAGDDVNEYNLSTAWDISSASYLQNFSVAAQETNPSGLFFKPDGTKMYVCGYTGDDVNEYDLSTAWNVSTASFVQVFDVSTEAATPFGVFFKDDGTKMYVLDNSGDDVSEYDLSTAWDISTASYLQNFSVQSLSGNNPVSLFFKDDGTKLYIGSSSIDAIFSYDL